MSWIKLHWISTLCNASDIMTKALPTTKSGAPCLIFLTALLMDIAFSEQTLTPAQRAYAEIFRLHGPPQCGFRLYDYHTCDSTFPACPLTSDTWRFIQIDNLCICSDDSYQLDPTFGGTTFLLVFQICHPWDLSASDFYHSLIFYTIYGLKYTFLDFYWLLLHRCYRFLRDGVYYLVKLLLRFPARRFQVVWWILHL